MHSWLTQFSTQATKELEKLDRSIGELIFDKIEWLAFHFDELTPEPLHGEWRGFYKFRVGDWRVIYDYDTARHVIRIHRVRHRDQVYKQR